MTVIRQAYRGRRRAAPIAVLAAALLLLSVGGGSARAADVTCGAVITQDTTLHGDLLSCPGDGLVIGADGVTLDLNGHTISYGANDHAFSGVDNNGGYDAVTVLDGRVQGYGNGVLLSNAADRNVVRGVTVTDTNLGIYLSGSNGELDRNTATGNNGSGIALGYATHDTVVSNVVTGNGFEGIELRTSSDNVLLGNLVTGNGFSRQPENGQEGITVLVSSARNLLEKNVVSGSATDGILVDASSTGTLLAKNETTQNGDDGIEVDDPATTLTKNRANANVDLGIEAVPGVTDGGGNRAGANGNPAQCTNVSCRT